MKHTLIFSGLLLGLLFLTTPNLHGQVAVQDSLALVDLYNNTDGPNWTNNSNWLVPGQEVRTWYGVFAGNRVTSINLVNNNLSGTLPVYW